MDVYEALYTTRMMRRMRSDGISLDVQSRIVEAAIRAPSGGNAQRWHFLVVDDTQIKSELAEIYQRCRQQEYAEIAAGTLAVMTHVEDADHAEHLPQIQAYPHYCAPPFADITFLVFDFA